MPLEYADFAKFYDDSGMTEDQQREHLAALGDILECVVRYIRWGRPALVEMPGLLLENGANSKNNDVELSKEIKTSFNRKAVKAEGRHP